MKKSEFIEWYSKGSGCTWTSLPLVNACLDESIRLFGSSVVNNQGFNEYFKGEDELKMIALLLVIHLKLLVGLQNEIPLLTFAGVSVPNDSDHQELLSRLISQLSDLS